MGKNSEGSGKNDVVYILKRDVEPDELRYSLRSLQNFPHGKVWFFTGSPAGFKPDRHVPFEQTGLRKWEKATSTYRAIAETDEVSEDFWMFNDDFFILEPVEDLPYMYHGRLAALIASIRSKHGASSYSRMLDRARLQLEERKLDSLNYCLHVPMLFNKKKVLEVLKEFPNSPMFRSLYGNYCKVGGVEANDCKVYDLESVPAEGQKLCSTYDVSFKDGKAGEWIRQRFPDPSKWEE